MTLEIIKNTRKKEKGKRKKDNKYEKYCMGYDWMRRCNRS